MYIKIDGVNIYYEVTGKGKVAVLTFHGGPGSSDCIDSKAWMGPLADEFCTIFYDNRGSGRSDDADPTTYNHKQFCEDAHYLVKHLGVEKVAIFGGSYGGFIAQEYAIYYPQEVVCMILRGTAACTLDLVENAKKNIMSQFNISKSDEEIINKVFDGNLASNKDLEEFFRITSTIYSTRYNPLKAEARMKSARYHYKTHNELFRNVVPKFDIREKIKNIKVPTLVIAGGKDWLIPVERAKELASLIPNAEFSLFEEAGHLVHEDFPQEFYQLVGNFLRKHLYNYKEN